MVMKQLLLVLDQTLVFHKVHKSLEMLLKKEEERRRLLEKDLAKEKEIAENCINTLKTYSEKVKAAHDIATQQGTSMQSNLSKH